MIYLGVKVIIVEMAWTLTNRELSRAASELGKRGFKAKLEKYGHEYIAEHARKVGKLGGRPRLPETEISKAALYYRARQERLKQQATKAASKDDERQKGR